MGILYDYCQSPGGDTAAALVELRCKQSPFCSSENVMHCDFVLSLLGYILTYLLNYYSNRVSTTPGNPGNLLVP